MAPYCASIGNNVVIAPAAPIVPIAGVDSIPSAAIALAALSVVNNAVPNRLARVGYLSASINDVCSIGAIVTVPLLSGNPFRSRN